MSGPIDGTAPKETTPEKTTTEETTPKETITATEEAFIKAVAKKAVKFDIPVPEDGEDPVSRLRNVRAPQQERWTDKTGAGTRHIATGPKDKQHPLTGGKNNSPEDASTAVGERLKTQGKTNRPGMAGALLIGSQTESSSSMRGRDPALHPVVQAILDELEASGGEKGFGHGRCAEVGVISNHLWGIDPSGSMPLDKLQAYFERRGAATVAHTVTQKNVLQVVAACPSCKYLTNKLCIATIRKPPPPPDEPDKTDKSD